MGKKLTKFEEQLSALPTGSVTVYSKQTKAVREYLDSIAGWWNSGKLDGVRISKILDLAKENGYTGSYTAFRGWLAAVEKKRKQT